jgi:hypothetical protein
MIGSLPGIVFKSISSCFREKKESTQTRLDVSHKNKYLPRSSRHKILKEAVNEMHCTVDDHKSTLNSEESILNSENENLDIQNDDTIINDIKLPENKQLKGILVTNRATSSSEIKISLPNKSNSYSKSQEIRHFENEKKSLSKTVSWNERVIVRKSNKKKFSIIKLTDEKS